MPHRAFIIIPLLVYSIVTWAQEKPKGIKASEVAQWQSLALNYENDNRSLHRNLAICTADSDARQAEIDKLTKRVAELEAQKK